MLMTVSLILEITGHFDLIEIYHIDMIGIIITELGIEIMFCISSWFFSFHILTLNIMSRDLKKMV